MDLFKSILFKSPPELSFEKRIIIRNISTQIAQAIAKFNQIAVARQTERQDTFEKLFHAQKQNLTGLDIIADELEVTDKDISDFIRYLRSGLAEFLEISKYMKNGEIGYETVSLSDIIVKLTQLLEKIIKHDRLIDKGLKVKTFQKDPLKKAVMEGTLFSGNFCECQSTFYKSPTGVAKLILKETLVNSVQHSKYDEPKVKINLEEEEHNFIITIKNNLCASEEQIKEMYNPSTVDKHGMTIINELANRIGWQKEYIRNEIENSTTYKFTIHKNG